jgi:hypothetical protein
MHEMILAYAGPDSLLPLTSALAAVIGAILFCWRWVVSFFKKAFQFFRKQ